MPSNSVMTLELSRQTTYLGKNGDCTCTGLIIQGHHDTKHSVVTLQSINIRMEPGRARISIPTKDIPNLIRKLEKFKRHHDEYRERHKKR